MLLNLVSYIDFCMVFTTHTKKKRSGEHQETLGGDGYVYYLENDAFMSAHIGPSSSNCVQ